MTIFVNVIAYVLMSSFCNRIQLFSEAVNVKEKIVWAQKKWIIRVDDPLFYSVKYLVSENSAAGFLFGTAHGTNVIGKRCHKISCERIRLNGGYHIPVCCKRNIIIAIQQIPNG